MLHNVAVLALPELAPFELGVLCEVFGLERADEPMLPRFDFALCTPRPGPVATKSGFSIDVPHGLERLAEADLVAVPAYACELAEPPEPAVLEALTSAVRRGARVLSVCSGVFALGHAGLLDGRRATSHWMFTDELQRLFPLAQVDPDVLYVEDGPILTSAGTAAGIDACLHLIRTEFGERAANRLARRMVVAPHRDGGQAQFIETPMHAQPAQTLEGLLTWLTEHLDREHTVEALAARAHMSPRTFARRFRAETGTTPYHWLTGQRILLAQRLLEETDETLDAVAARTGFGTAPLLRHHFTKWRGTTPQAYRRAFRPRAA